MLNWKNYFQKNKVPFIIISILILLSFSIITFLAYNYYQIFYVPMQKYKTLHIGMSYEDIITQYGQPDYRVSTQQELSEIKALSSYYPKPKKEIKNRVLIYFVRPIYVFFIYLDKNDKVEAILKANT